LEICVKAIPGGIVSNWLHTDLKEGGTVKLSPPFGAFTMAKGEDPVLLSAGIGITPMMSFGKQLLKENKPDVVHVHVDGSEDFPWRNDYYPRGDLKVTFRRTTSKSDMPSMEELLKLTGDVSKKDVFICGPVQFMDCVVPFFRKHAKSVKYENFGPRVQV
jgi:ferredoxin-NADP reductase